MARARGLPPGYRPGDPLVHFRRIPGTRTFYNPRNEQRFSEHFVVRQYRPSRTVSEREAIRQVSRQVGSRRARSHSTILSHYRLKLASEGRPWNQAERDRFAQLYTRLQQLNREAALLQAQAQVTRRDNMLAANGEYAGVLEELGRREPDADYMVGQSPEGIVATLAMQFTGG